MHDWQIIFPDGRVVEPGAVQRHEGTGDEPLVSVIIPTCDRPELLGNALSSLVRQGCKDFEAVVVNDGAVDIKSVLTSFSGKLRITACRHDIPRKGLSTARNTGLEAARGKYIAYLDDDDFYFEDHLEVLLQCAEHTKFPVIYTDGLYARQRLIDDEWVTVRRKLYYSNQFSHASLAEANLAPVLAMMHTKKCLERTGKFAPYLRSHEDWDLWQRMARHHPFLHAPTITAEYTDRIGGGSLSKKTQVMAETWLFVRKQGMLYESIPPVYELETRIADARGIGALPERTRICLIVGVGNASEFLRNEAAMRAFARLCGQTPALADGRACLLVAGFGEAMPELYAHAVKMTTGSVQCIWFRSDPGRLLAANTAAAVATEAGPEWLLFLEPFVEPQHAEWLDAMLAAGEAEPCSAAVTPLLSIGKALLAGGRISQRGELVFNRSAPSSSPAVVDCLPGMCLMVRLDAFTAVGGFRLSFAPWHYADADLCLRLRREGGVCVVAPESRFLWNNYGAPLVRTSSGLIGRRTFWDTWSESHFPHQSLTTGTDWSMRPEGSALLWPSDGIVPERMDPPLPPSLLVTGTGDDDNQ